MSQTLLLLALISLLLELVYSKTSFVKDLKTDVPFPPVNTQHVAGIPEGHLRPLGWQKKPDGKIREEKDPMNTPTFHMRYIQNSRPAVFRGAIKGTPVLAKWEDDPYLKEKFGKVNVTITVKRELEKKRFKRRMLFRKFLLDYMYENWYLASTVHNDILAELPLPELLQCGSYKDRLTEAEMWMSSGGTSSLLHSHGDHNLHCVIDGRKDFIVIEPQHKAVFRYEEAYPNAGYGHSPMDMEMINVFKNPKISKTPWTWSTLWQGDCIYIPAGHLHQVRAYGRSISYTVQFAPTKEFESEDCKEESRSKRRKKDKKERDKTEEKDKRLTLADVQLVWAYSEGKRHLSDTNMSPESLRRLLLLLMGDRDQLHQSQFEHFYEEALEEDDQRPPADEIFHVMTPNNTHDTLSRDEVLAIVPSRLQRVCEVFNRIYQKAHDEL